MGEGLGVSLMGILWGEEREEQKSEKMSRRGVGMTATIQRHFQNKIFDDADDDI